MLRSTGVKRLPPRFFFRGRCNTATYYSSRGGAEGHPDMVAECVDGGRTDPEWMWVKLLCLFCVGSTLGTSLWQIYFYEQAKLFKDEPWSPFKH
ncbi:hypothetical protein TRSC58_03330 [Trypanosoma rangeli SC58]|uniref:Uncharacterized protein n=1 Tax=Trypanosoma rangeli SC58 TaxID=429131 RepID=A0A061J6M7_TRYRA|nr:hypothetical protein TRSC58_03330 [Trypanosoma rangeli SC58]